MIDQFLDQLEGNTDHRHHTATNPLMTAAATYLGNKVFQNHHHDPIQGGHNHSHFWKNLALTGALAYGWHKYKDHHRQQAPPYQPQPIYQQPCHYSVPSPHSYRHDMTMYPNDRYYYQPHHYDRRMTAPRLYRHGYFYHPSLHMVTSRHPYRSLY